MNSYLDFSKKIAESFSDIAFLKFLFPFLAIVGSGVFLFYGIKGIWKKNTISLRKIKGMSFTDSQRQITGTSAVIFGVIYLIIGLALFVFLGGISWYILF